MQGPPRPLQSSFSNVHEETGYHLPETLLLWLFPITSLIECRKRLLDGEDQRSQVAQ